jgi:hypothetical protein
MLQTLLAEGRPLLADGATGPISSPTYAALAVDYGAGVIGGCCGNTPSHVAPIRRGLDACQPGARPGVASIVAALGELASPPAVAASARTRRRAAK